MTQLVPSKSLLALAHWRCSTAEMYALVRQSEDPFQAWQLFVKQRNHLFKVHGQSPLDPGQQASFRSLSYYPYDPAFRVIGHLDHDVETMELAIDLGEDGLLRLKRIATINFELQSHPARLCLFWVQGYGGGLFLPFKDQTNQSKSFSGGRYLYDTIKGADLGAGENKILLDFNFAYNPSCAYSPRWVCPLAPEENNLYLPIDAGEKRFTAGEMDASK